jgi:hypothetical protein
MKRAIATLLIACLCSGLSVFSATAAVKPGAVCKKKGQVSTSTGKKFTCIKNGKKLTWSYGVTVKKALPAATPTPVPTPVTSPIQSPAPSPIPASFDAWSLDIDSKLLSDQSQRNFISWAKTRAGSSVNHIQLVDPSLQNNRMSILKKADDLGAQLFSSYFEQGSKTVIGATEGWTIDQLAKSGWLTKKCNDPYMSGVALCLKAPSHQGYVVTGDSTYNARDPGKDGGALLAHEYFHLVQANLANKPLGIEVRSELGSVSTIPVWFVEGTAEFVGYSVGALAQNASYWDGRTNMLSYSPREESVNRNSIVDYELRTCCGNGTPTYSYNIGQVATEYIVASIGFQKILDIWIDYANTRNFEKSFETVTGISKATFYEKFDLVRTKVGLPAISWKLEGLVNKKL